MGERLRSCRIMNGILYAELNVKKCTVLIFELEEEFLNLKSLFFANGRFYGRVVMFVPSFIYLKGVSYKIVRYCIWHHEKAW